MTRIEQLADEVLDLLIEEDPLAETIQGLPGVDSRLSDLDEAAEADLRSRALAAAKAAEELSTEDWVTKAVVVNQAEAIAARIESRLIEHAVADLIISPMTRLLNLLPLVRPKGTEAEQNFFTRLRTIPEYIDKAITRHRTGTAAGRSPVGSRVAYAVSYLDNYLANPADDPLRRVSLSNTAERDRLLDELVRPAFATYRQVLADEIAPQSRPDDKPGLCWLPDGEAAYAALARVHTTTDRTAKDLHQVGLDLIAALAEEYVEIGSKVFGVHTVAEVHHRLRTDPALKWGSAEEMLAGARAAMDRAEQAAPQWFGVTPSQACELQAVPEADAPHEAGAYYYPPALDGSKPGIYYANTYKATERDRYISEAIAFHEAVPGHHFQLTIAQELTGLPKLRRYALINSYSEGWGLYCERLADEMGLYSDDVSRLGMLATDSMRAARLVVDTGLHALGWSRQRTVDYLRENTVMSEVEIQSETDRYIEMPGQALSYMVGRLEIQRLRARAAERLGAEFDVKAFHDLVLSSGPLPMAVLDDVVAEWTSART
ncbi:uncharacterized protein (DUF885 family) [Kibdelosporangium banguiense]|uniref:Uncharacterized protein (DUF885 family) n=1 Tax=Kibdelosporangium banguiense TaxID=1365924 RepID=A0ABS4T5I4_9PSEU|nr:DUF885 domain-containing protein [Kibdelosporangium banguiense]MBP2319722.1 uncharacterized protein (DUF885 family) [Kibdelosporangium banguiense]